MHNGDRIAQKLIQSDILRLCRGQRDLCLQLAPPDDGADGVQDGVAGRRLGGAWIGAVNTDTPFAKKVGVGVHFKDFFTSGIQHDLLSPRGLEILNQLDYWASV